MRGPGAGDWGLMFGNPSPQPPAPSPRLSGSHIAPGHTSTDKRTPLAPASATLRQRSRRRKPLAGSSTNTRHTSPGTLPRSTAGGGKNEQIRARRTIADGTSRRRDRSQDTFCRQRLSVLVHSPPAGSRWKRFGLRYFAAECPSIAPTMADQRSPNILAASPLGFPQGLPAKEAARTLGPTEGI